MDINYISPINMLGYGICGLNIFQALSKNNKVALWILGQAEAHPKFHDSLRQGMANAIYFNKRAACIRLWHQFDMSMMVGKGLHIGFPFFELNRFNQVELHHLKSLDHIFVASQWAKEVLAGEGIVDSVTVAPLGVDTEIFFPNPQPRTSETVRFLNIGKWEIRKGHDVLIKAFNKAFEPTDNVELIMNCHNPFLVSAQDDGNKQWESLYKNSKMGDKITIISNRLENQEEVADLMNSVDCGVFPSRAEGWNMELIEMMACGKSLIATDYSGHTEFIPNSNVRSIEITKLESAEDGKWFHGDGDWAEFGDKQMDQLIHQMRNVYKWHHKDDNSASLRQAKLFTWKKTASIIEGVLNERNRD